jgi:two-component system, chemotaxis family, chemotaxis protein CheY
MPSCLDLMMPVMDGSAFLQQRRAQAVCGSAPIVVVSASRRAGETIKGLGVAGCVAKPFDLDELLSAVGCAIR